jgi:hypothetical protein
MARLRVVLGKEERSVGAVDRVCIEELVNRAQKTFWLCQGESALAANVGTTPVPSPSHRSIKEQNVLDKPVEVIVVEFKS